MIKLTCHCGNIELMLSKLPTEATKCNCSICHRYGALWSYFPKK
ncbi:GFA family protein [Vibrio porteresiae]